MTEPITDHSRSGLRVILLLIAVLLALPIFLMIFMLPMGMMGWGGGPGSGMILPPLLGIGMMVALFIVLLGSGFVLYRVVTRGSLDSTDRALEELRLAYARGELSQEEFEQRRKDLERTEHP
ncbi:SHOCT domain-containing protein [Halocatena halophila]|uniref:SHOCT domain-containing protein n=1 Tax=Halocatena halophila TaxID=2814576 RepID=UPI002ED53C40